MAPPPRDVEPLPYLDDRDAEPWGLDVALEVRLPGHTVSRTPFASMYWTFAQMLAHMTDNGAPGPAAMPRDQPSGIRQTSIARWVPFHAWHIFTTYATE